jgi:hypothetical protein
MAERLTRPKGYLTKSKTKSPDAARKAKAKEIFTPKGLGKEILNAALSGAPIGRGAKAAGGIGKVVRQTLTRKDPVVTKNMQAIAKYKKNMDKSEKAESKATSLASARTRANIDKMEKSGNYKKTGNAKPNKPAAKPQPAKPTREQILRANRTRDLKAAKYKGSLSKEPKPLSETPRLSNETKKLLEKFQTPKVQPPSTRTSMGGMIGEARPAAAGARRETKRQEYKKRPVTRTRINPKEIKEERIKKAIAAKQAKVKIEPTGKPSKLTPPARPKTKKPLTKSNRSGKYDKRADELDLSTDKDIQTVRGKEYPEGFPMKPRFAGKTIESRSSQNPSARGKEVKQVDEARKRKEDVRENKENEKLDEQLRLAGTSYFPKSNPNKRLPRKTLEDRRVQLKKQARSKRAASTAAEVKRKEALARLTPAQRLRVKRMVKETVENSKKK